MKATKQIKETSKFFARSEKWAAKIDKAETVEEIEGMITGSDLIQWRMKIEREAKAEREAQELYGDTQTGDKFTSL